MSRCLCLDPRWLAGALALSACSDDASASGGGGGVELPGGGGADAVGGAGGSTPEVPDGAIEIAMRDGVKLKTWVHVPSGGGPWPLFVVRNPYAALNDDASLEAYAQFFQDQGIGLVWQAARGTGGSEGEFVPYVSEVADAEDTLAWLGAQPWSNGRFATGGGSYLGYTAWAAAAADPRVRVVLSDDTAADEEMTRHGGVVDGYLLSWWSFVERERFADETEQDSLTNMLDLPNADEAVLGRDLPYWNDLLQAGLATYPEAAALRTLAKDICTPALHIVEGSTGWRDPIETWHVALGPNGASLELPTMPP
jgi:predicted acyl esterase